MDMCLACYVFLLVLISIQFMLLGYVFMAITVYRNYRCIIIVYEYMI